MTRGRLLFAVVLLAAMGAAPDRARAGASAPWFALSGGVSDSAAADAGLADMPAIDDRLEPSTLAAGLSGIDNGEFFVAPASEIAGARELGHTAVFGASGLASGAFGEDGSDVLGMPASAVTVELDTRAVVAGRFLRCDKRVGIGGRGRPGRAAERGRSDCCVFG